MIQGGMGAAERPGTQTDFTAKDTKEHNGFPS